MTTPDTSADSASFRGLLLRYRGRTGLTQREVAGRVGVNRRSVKGWELGAGVAGADRLEELIRVLLEADGLTPGQETAEARALWAEAQSESARTYSPFDTAWFARLLAERAAPADAPDTAHATLPARPTEPVRERRTAERRHDWGEAPDTTGFVGRGGELALLRRWVLDERCRLLPILGVGGIGKTSLAARLAQEVAPGFERVYWRSLRHMPPASEWLAGAIGFLSDQRLVPPAPESERLAALLRLLRERRCLLVLDNAETLYEPGQRDGRYRAGMAGYGRLLQAVGETSHQSCLVVTSREAPPELAVLDSDTVRTFKLGGLGVLEGQVMLAHQQLAGEEEAWARLITRYGGNSLALKLVGESIRQVFGGEIGAFLDEVDAGAVFGGMRRLLAEQVERSSALEHQVLRVLAVEREPVTLAELLAELGPRVGRGAVLEAVEALRRRSLMERAVTAGAVAFTLQSVVREYVNDRLVEQVADGIGSRQPILLLRCQA
jgi:transcriptional regulator with XRE-family HTH domain